MCHKVMCNLITDSYSYFDISRFALRAVFSVKERAQKDVILNSELHFGLIDRWHFLLEKNEIGAKKTLVES